MYDNAILGRLAQLPGHLKEMPDNASSTRPISLALLCSTKCPGTIVVRALDVAAALRDDPANRVTIVSGFQSPVERECLKFLLHPRGTVPLVICPARSVVGPPPMRIPAAWKPAIAAGRLTIRSAIDEGFAPATGPAPTPQKSPRPPEIQHRSSQPRKAPRRPTLALAEHRNRFVASIANAVLILHATPGGKLDRLADELLAAGKPVWTLDDPANGDLLSRGARSIKVDGSGVDVQRLLNPEHPVP